MKPLQISLLAFCLGLSALSAQESFRLDLPLTESAVSPSWLHWSMPDSDPLSQLACTLTPPYPIGQELLVTVLFEDSPDSFLRIIRQTGETAETLTENLLEGVTGINQRTLHLKQLAPDSPTTITFQAGSRTLPIRRLVWQWVKPRVILADDNAREVVAVRGSLTLRGEEISGAALPTPLVKFQPNFVSVPLVDQPELIGEGVSFLVILPQAPTQTRFALQTMMAQVGDRLSCWLNGRRVADGSPQLPSLTDEGYLLNSLRYAGWLPTTIHLPAELWRVGENLLELFPISAQGESSTSPHNIKDLLLELCLPSAPTP